MPRRLSPAKRRAKRAAAFQLFAPRDARKRRPHLDPNDRTYDRDVAGAAKRMDPSALDALLRHGEDEPEEA